MKKGVIQEKILLYKVLTKKDTEAFAALYDIYVEPIYRFVLFKLSHKEEAEDVTADIFLKCWQYLINAEKKEIRNFNSLLYTIARHRVIEVYRARARKNERSLYQVQEAELSDSGAVAEALQGFQDAQVLMGMMKKLKQEYQEVLLLRYIEGFSIEEVGAITGKSSISVRVTLHRAIKKIREMLTHTGDQI